ncbi:MAG: hypothetical protein KDD45_13935 [Bdellovibrionales bacterium]|nr:hypothetical protein [Bdellovibrionales bacterium]
MEKTKLHKSILAFEQTSNDFISHTLNKEDKELKEDLRKRKLKLLGLGSIYVLLVLISFTLLT